jgi:DNA mismatch endonuclease, patch repair protein
MTPILRQRPEQQVRPFKQIERALAGRSAVSTTEAASARMARVRRHATAPELVVRKAARSLGLRFTVRNSDLPGSPDLANRTRKLAVFVHGCFWHRHRGCKRTTTPKRNRRFWEAKFRANQARDRKALRLLSDRGFEAIVIWECATRNDGKVIELLSHLIKTRS